MQPPSIYISISIRDTQKYITYFNNFANTENNHVILRKNEYVSQVCQAVEYNVTGSSVFLSSKVLSHRLHISVQRRSCFLPE